MKAEGELDRRLKVSKLEAEGKAEGWRGRLKGRQRWKRIARRQKKRPKA